MAAKIVELIDVQIMAGQVCLTRFHYLDADGVADEAILVADYLADCVQTMANFQSTALSHVAIRHRQVYPTPTLAAEVPINPIIGGAQSGTPAESFVTFSMKYNVGPTTQLGGSDGSHISRGGKHLPGVTTTDVAGDALPRGALQSTINTWWTAVKDPGTDPWQLIVASFETGRSHKVKVGNVTTITTPAPSAIVTKYATILGISVASTSTQNTRKVLRGHTY